MPNLNYQLLDVCSSPASGTSGERVAERGPSGGPLQGPQLGHCVPHGSPAGCGASWGSCFEGVWLRGHPSIPETNSSQNCVRVGDKSFQRWPLLKGLLFINPNRLAPHLEDVVLLCCRDLGFRQLHHGGLCLLLELKSKRDKSKFT